MVITQMEGVQSINDQYIIVNVPTGTTEMSILFMCTPMYMVFVFTLVILDIWGTAIRFVKLLKMIFACDV